MALVWSYDLCTVLGRGGAASGWIVGCFAFMRGGSAVLFYFTASGLALHHYRKRAMVMMVISALCCFITAGVFYSGRCHKILRYKVDNNTGEEEDQTARLFQWVVLLVADLLG